MDDSELDLGQTIRGFVAGQKLFGRYTLKKILGRGGMGIVCLARDENLEREVALKFLPDLLLHDRGILEGLKRETKRSLALTHPHIVRIYDFVQDSQTACISMEYVDGDTLSNLRADKENQVFEPEEIALYVRQLCEALDYAHTRAKIVHRDLKPANLIISSQSELKIMDFGIARSLSESVSMMTMNRGSSGTLVYMSPQQLDDEPATIQDDVYSAGVTLYELLTSKPPFFGGNIDRNIHEKIPPSMASRRAEFGITGKAIPVRWEQTVAACLAKDPEERPQSAQEVAYRLGLVEHFTLSPTPKPARPEVLRVPLKTRLGKKKGVLAAALVTLLVVGALGGWWLGVEQPRKAAERQRQSTEQAQKTKDVKDSEAAKREKAEQERLEGERKAKATADVENARLAAAERVKEEVAKKKAEPANFAAATKEHPYENSLGMKFVPVAGTNVLFSIWDTRVQDYDAFVKATGQEWPRAYFEQGPTHPAVNVSWDDAKSFCRWLTKKEQHAGTLGAEHEYRLPTDVEWSVTVGLPPENGDTPEEKHGKTDGYYPWGRQWPPPNGAGNYDPVFHVDTYLHTSPVGTFTPNKYGLYDMGGNVWQWCEDYDNRENKYRVTRGGSWDGNYSGSLLSSFRKVNPPEVRYASNGFRCVLVVDSSR